MKLSAVADEYRALFSTAVISPRRIGEVDAAITRIMLHQDQYLAVEKAVTRLADGAVIGTVPWYVIALIHNLECSLNFGQHLHNGDSLARPTHNDPAGRPPGWLDFPEEQRTWLRSAVDALRYDRLDQYTDWDVARICYCFETFNGWGYRGHGIHSPYLWAGTQHYTRGKYVRDGVYASEAVSEQIGSGVLLLRMTERNLVSLRAAV